MVFIFQQITWKLSASASISSVLPFGSTMVTFNPGAHEKSRVSFPSEEAGDMRFPYIRNPPAPGTRKASTGSPYLSDNRFHRGKRIDIRLAPLASFSSLASQESQTLLRVPLHGRSVDRDEAEGHGIALLPLEIV